MFQCHHISYRKWYVRWWPKNKTHNSRIMRKDKKYIDEPLSSSSENNDPKVIKGNYLFAGPLYSHFGHILTESIHRLYGYNKDSFDGVIFVVHLLLHQA